MGDLSGSSLKNHYFHCFITYSVGRKRCAVDIISACVRCFVPSVQSGDVAATLVTVKLPRDPVRGHCQAGSLTGAVHLSKNNAGVLRPAQRGQKPRVEQKGKSWLDPDVQYA